MPNRTIGECIAERPKPWAEVYFNGGEYGLTLGGQVCIAGPWPWPVEDWGTSPDRSAMARIAEALNEPTAAELAEVRERAKALTRLDTDPDDNERGVYPSEMEGAMP